MITFSPTYLRGNFVSALKTVWRKNDAFQIGEQNSLLGPFHPFLNFVCWVICYFELKGIAMEFLLSLLWFQSLKDAESWNKSAAMSLRYTELLENTLALKYQD